MKILLAVSGGIDSMCMADMALHGKILSGSTFGIAHCNFCLRGDESDGDEHLVKEWSRESGLPFHHIKFRTEEYATQNGISIEMAARDLRYEWFAKTCKSYGYDAVAVAHNADDNAETLMLNLLRGTGLRGMCGMRREGVLPSDSTIPLLRPLLDMPRAEIDAYARKNGVPYRNDRTNSETIYKRNMIRHKVMPVFKEINPSCLEALSRDMKHAAEAEAIAESYFTEASRKVWNEADNSISVKALTSLEHWHYVLYRLMEPFGITGQSLSSLSDSIEARNESTFAGRTYPGTDGWVAVTAADKIVITQPTTCSDNEVTVTGPGEYICCGRHITVSTFKYSAEMPLKQPEGTTVLDAKAAAFPLVLRSWRDGDWMRPLGMKGRRKKLSDMFVDMKWSILDKQSAVVALKEGKEPGHVLCLVGHKIDNAARVIPDSVEIICIKIS